MTNQVIEERVTNESRLTKIEMSISRLCEINIDLNKTMSEMARQQVDIMSSIAEQQAELAKQQSATLANQIKMEEHREADRRDKDRQQSEINEVRQELKDHKKDQFEPVRKKAEFNAAMLYVAGSLTTMLAGALIAKLIGG